MNRTALLLACFLFNLSLMAQISPIRIAMTAERWAFPAGTCEFLSYRSVPALPLLTSRDTAVLKGLRFTNGTIEYDIEPQDNDFTGFFFRREDGRESEYFYLRVFAGAIPNIQTSVQYAPIIGGVNIWNLLPYDQGNAKFAKGQWNHVK